MGMGRPVSVIFIGLYWMALTIFYFVILLASSASIVEKFGAIFFLTLMGILFLNFIMVFYIFQMKKIGLIAMTLIFVFNVLRIIHACMSGACFGSIVGLFITGYLLAILWKNFDKMSWGFTPKYIEEIDY